MHPLLARSSRTLTLAAGIVAALCNGAASADEATVTGWLSVLHGKGAPASGVEEVHGVLLKEDSGTCWELHADAHDEEVEALDRCRVVVRGELVKGEEELHVLSIAAAPTQAAAAGQASGASFNVQPLTGPQRWVTILVRFADQTGTTPHAASWFQTLMGSTAPGMDHYWREVSYEAINLTGSVVVGWYNLPQPKSYYVVSNQIVWDRAMNDATAAADADVYFPNFAGINLMFNDTIGNAAWGGTSIVSRDGVGRIYSATWMPPWGYENHNVLGQEMGHGFGLPHSSGPYSQTYDSNWDVQSGGGTGNPSDPNYGSIGVHTVAYHKDRLNWIPSSRLYVASAGTATVEIERTALPVSATNYLMARIPIPGTTTRYYTVEARRFVGYDIRVPAEGVLIHLVDTTRSDRNAQVVDGSNNGDPNDAGAIWTPGETFTDATNAITVQVVSAGASSYTVTITAGSGGGGGGGTTDDHGNTSATATSIQNDGTSVAGNIETGGDVDYFSFAATAGTAYVLSTGSLGTGMDTVLTLFGTDGASVLGEDDDSGGSYASLLSWTAPAAGTYYVGVRHYSPTGTGTYRVSALGETVTPPAASGTAVAGFGVGGNGWVVTMPGSGQADWKRNTFAPQGIIRPSIGNLDGDPNPDMVLGFGRGAGGWVALYERASGAWGLIRWYRVPWSAYNAANGETCPALGDMDGDGLDEIAIGLGSGGGGNVAIVRAPGLVPTFGRWIAVTWAAYNSANGETRPAFANADADAAKELVVGLGSGSGGWLQVFDDLSTAQRLMWIQVPLASYNSANGETRPAGGNLDGGTQGRIVVGLGAGSGGQMYVYNPYTSAWAPRTATGPSTWNGETRPACADADGDGTADLLVGLGAGGAGQMRLTNFATPGASRDLTVPWSVYNGANGETWPALMR
ncbi:MAG: pre-peptidase C-terminal domain-containing protein [Planctomycetota bacterium]